MNSDNVTSSEPVAGCLIRLFWMVFGNLSLFITALMIIRKGNIINLSIVFWVLAILIIICRYVEIKYFNGKTCDASGIATLKDWKRYTVFSFSGYLIAWVLVIACRIFLIG